MRNLPTDVIVTGEPDFKPSEDFLNMLSEEINDYLADKYNFCNCGWCWELKISDIEWDIGE